MEPTAQNGHVDVSLSTNSRKGGPLGQTYLDHRSTERKSTSHGPTQQDSKKNISNLLTQMKKKDMKLITYIKTTACIEEMRRCVQISRLKHVGAKP